MNNEQILKLEKKIEEYNLFKKIKNQIKEIEFISEEDGYYLEAIETYKYQDEYKYQEVWVSNKDKITIRYENLIYPYDNKIIENNYSKDKLLQQEIESEKPTQIKIEFEKKYLLYALGITFFLVQNTDTGDLDYKDIRYHPIVIMNKEELPIKGGATDENYLPLNGFLGIKEEDLINKISKKIKEKNEIIIINRSIHDIYNKAMYAIGFESPYYEDEWLASIESKRIYK